MYIKEIEIAGFRNFKEAKVPFHEGVNVIIGHNNTGKSNLLRALGLVLGFYNNRDLHTNDLFYETDVNVLKAQSPRMCITITLHRSTGEPDDSQEMGLFSDIMTDPNLNTEATMSYIYALTADEEDNYMADVAGVATAKEIWKIIDRDYIRKCQSNRIGGAGVNTRRKLAQIDFQFLDAIRDVGRDLYAGYNPLLREVLNFFIDYSVKNDDTKDDDVKNGELKTLRDSFLAQSNPLMTTLQDRLQAGKDIFLKYAKDAGATFNSAEPDFDGDLTENEMFSALRLIIKYAAGIEIPATYNGLGYNNLIFMSLLLAKMQAEANSSFMKRNTKLLSFLAVEECEAHLHPAMQYKFLQFLQDNKQNQHIRQAFITTHSTQIASAVKIDDLICLTTPSIGQLSVGYLREVFKNTAADINSKQFVQRFLDATRADMFFASKLIFVEGVAEELLLPVFAKYLGYDLTDAHVLVVNMGGRYFSHFLKMFNTLQPMTINKRIACITDIDPVEKENGAEDYEACYPYEYGIKADSQYQHHGDGEVAQYAAHPNIRFFRQDSIYGKTLEYDLMRENIDCEEILTESVKNKNEIRRLKAEQNIDTMLDNILRNSEENRRIAASIRNCGWGNDEKRKAIIASRYLNAVSKGANALELNVALEENLKKAPADRFEFHVPQYIEEALRWLLS